MWYVYGWYKAWKIKSLDAKGEASGQNTNVDHYCEKKSFLQKLFYQKVTKKHLLLHILKIQTRLLIPLTNIWIKVPPVYIVIVGYLCISKYIIVLVWFIKIKYWRNPFFGHWAQIPPPTLIFSCFYAYFSFRKEVLLRSLIG